MAQLAAFEQRLTELGWQVGTTLSIQYRFPAGDVGKMQIFAEELVADDPDVLVACATPETAALKNATNTIPIIFWANTDPVGSGLVESLAHPGGNVTGFQGFEYSLAGQWIDLLHKAAPAMRRVGFIYNPTSIPFFKHYVDVGRDAAGKLGLEFIDQPVRTPEEIEPAFAGLAGGDGGSVAPPDSFTAAYVDIFASSQRRYGVPAIFAFKSFPQKGGLMSYGYNEATLAAQAAEYADRALRGARPADLPVQAPRAYDLVLNLSAAKALGVAFPPDLLARAAQVIE
jgi:putative ABC transport system substrate-binding protein